jgi:hypothetical protein
MEIKNSYEIIENSKLKFCKSLDYNYVFNKEDGFFARWGKTKEDDPNYAPAPEIADIEVTTKCNGVTGINGKPSVCKFCYKSNTANGHNMSFETFKNIFHKLPINLTQIAFGADSHATSNPDLFKMMEYCRNNDYNKVVPNITVAEISEETADLLAKYCGAVAVSRYDNKNICYDTVNMLTSRGMDQINIHHLVAKETYCQLMETLNDILTDPRLKKLNAIVLLSLKQCGRGSNYNILSQEKFNHLLEFAFSNNITIGFDSCSCHRFLDCVKNKDNYEKIKLFSEPCESTLFSIYISAEGKFYPCSFCENIENYEDYEIDMINCDDFINDVWMSEKAMNFRKKLLDNDRACPVYKIY